MLHNNTRTFLASLLEDSGAQWPNYHSLYTRVTPGFVNVTTLASDCWLLWLDAISTLPHIGQFEIDIIDVYMWYCVYQHNGVWWYMKHILNLTFILSLINMHALKWCVHYIDSITPCKWRAHTSRESLLSEKLNLW